MKPLLIKINLTIKKQTIYFIQMKKEYYLQQAALDDIPVLVTHHRQMFEEIWTFRGLELSDQKLKKMDHAYYMKLNKEIESGKCIAWVIKKESRILASGAISIASFVPTPDDSSSKIAYVHSIYTENKYRKQGFASNILESIICYCKVHNIKRVMLHTSEAGKALYQEIGFQISDNSMSLFLQ